VTPPSGFRPNSESFSSVPCRRCELMWKISESARWAWLKCEGTKAQLKIKSIGRLKTPLLHNLRAELRHSEIPTLFIPYSFFYGSGDALIELYFGTPIRLSRSTYRGSDRSESSMKSVFSAISLRVSCSDKAIFSHSNACCLSLKTANQFRNSYGDV
jgi:hypothetical protein